MIKLTLQVGTQQAQKSFHQDVVLLGAASEDLQDLSVDLSSLLPEHIRIFEQGGAFFAQNLANDPFVTLNDRPFGKKQLTNGDRLAVGEVEIVFEGEATAISPAAPQKDLESLAETLDFSIKRTTTTRSTFVAQDFAFEDDDEDFEALIRQVENFDPSNEQPESEQPESEKLARLGPETIQQQTSETSAKSFKAQRAVRPKRAESAAIKQHFAIPEAPRVFYWRPVVAVLVVLVAVVAAVGSGLYFTFSEKNDEQEYIAAQGLSDMALALTYAQMHQIKPPNQNWSDPDFIKEILAKVLPSDYTSLISIDKQGYFTNCPYLLRVYTNSDLSQFLLLAQPEPSLWQWLLARETIIVDSRTMELRHTTDLRALNRLLANTKPLEAANALEISHLVSQSSLMRLTSLASETGLREFLPPKGLSKAVPGADLRIYNAPRYYRLSTPVTHSLGQVVTALTSPADDKIQELRKSVAELSKLSHFVFYSDQQESTTVKIVELLDSWFPDVPPVVAQLHLEPATGRVLSSYVMGSVPAVPELQQITQEWIPHVEDPQEAEVVAMSEHAQHTYEIESAVKQELRRALEKRKEALDAYKQKMDELLDEFIKAPSADFVHAATQLIHDIDDVDLGEQLDVRQAIVDTYRQYVLDDKIFSHSEFLAETHNLGIEPYLPPEFVHPEGVELEIDFGHDHSQVQSPTMQQMEEHETSFVAALNHIQHADSFDLIEQAVSEANQELSQDPNTDAERLRMLRNKLQLQVVHRLEELILGPSSPLPADAYVEANRARILNILASTGIDDEGIHDYYVREFDLLLEQRADPQ